ncbi:MAG: tetratricopeptide repeat protein [Blastocatellia bacterium]|nr:tetratricopeptide repeat protein [Blastocatellia bacterium]
MSISQTDMAAVRPETPAANVPGPWIVSPFWDIVVGCGGWSAPLLLAAMWLDRGNNPAVSLLSYGLLLVCNYPHFMATIYRAYRTQTDFAKYRIFTVHLTGLLVLTALLAHWSVSLLPWVVTLYVIWSPWHYAGQNFGLALMFARRNGVQPSRVDRELLYGAFIGLYLVTFLSIHTGPATDQYLLSFDFPLILTRVLRIGLMVVSLLMGGLALKRISRKGGRSAAVAPGWLLLTQFLWAVPPTLRELVTGVQLQQIYYTSGVLAVMHSAQYLWLTNYYAKREAEAEGAGTWNPWRYFALLVVGGIALFLPGPWLVSRVFHYDFTASFLIFTAVVNLHHCMLNGVIWKLRESRVAAFLLNQKVEVKPAADQMGRAFGQVLDWFFGSTAPAQGLRVLLAAGLLLLAGIDQWRYRLSLDEDNLFNLQKAEWVNPNDSLIQLRIAKVTAKAGRNEESLVALRRAVAINPHDAKAQNLLAQALLQQNRFDEAYRHFQQMLVNLPSNLDTLVNFGNLAVQAGKPTEAIDAWERALRLEPAQQAVRLNLADVYDQLGQPDKAVAHYETFLSQLLQSGNVDEGKANPKQVLGIALKIAKNYARTGNLERARAYYEKAVPLAAKAQEKNLESLALLQLGEIQAGQGNKSQAVELYQRGLKLDAEAGDRKAEALDWLAYAQLLDHLGATPRLVLASALKSEELLQPTPGPELEAVVKFRADLEQKLGPQAAEVRRNAKDLATEALGVKL